MTGIGIVTLIILALFNSMGIEADSGTITAALEGLVTFVAWAFTIWGQVRRKDLDFGLWRI